MKIDYTPGLDLYMKEIQKLCDNTLGCMKQSLFEGAGIIADEIHQGLESLPVEETSKGTAPFAYKGKKLKGVTSQQKADILENFGIAAHRSEGGAVTTLIGVRGSGYTVSNDGEGEVPINVILRSIESGCSFREKNPIIHNAVNRSKSKAIDAMNKKFETIIEEAMKG